ncbi:hypothetical protein DTO027B5_5307 [Paecilomyces variotii]|nr:hypothetical protein DTO027B3_8148 [Paecilomyces variotii]KAJ9332880.1 hypothetical protein DTO027B5_5307 [Paecilomyces variotii]
MIVKSTVKNVDGKRHVVWKKKKFAGRERKTPEFIARACLRLPRDAILVGPRRLADSALARASGGGFGNGGFACLSYLGELWHVLPGALAGMKRKLLADGDADEERYRYASLGAAVRCSVLTDIS